MPSARIAGLWVAIIGGFVSVQVTSWTIAAIESFQDSSDVLTLALWIACSTAVLAATVAALWLAVKQSSWKRGNSIALAAIAIGISVVGTLAFWVNAMIGVYRAHDAQQSLTLSRLGLAACTGTFLISVIALLRRMIFS